MSTPSTGSWTSLSFALVGHPDRADRSGPALMESGAKGAIAWRAEAAPAGYSGCRASAVAVARWVIWCQAAGVSA